MTGRRPGVLGAVVLAALLVGCGGSPGTGAPSAPQTSVPSTPGASTSAPGASAPSTSIPGTSTPGSDGAGSIPVPAGAGRVADPATVPVRLQVPAAGVDVSLIGLGIAPDGTLEVPVDYQEVGWFDVGPAPGDVGPAVIAGHVDSTDGPAPFFSLRDLVPGEGITVTRADGSTVAFTVDGVEQYAKDAFPTASVYGPVPGPALRLITCGGSFDRSVGHYRDNVVVYAS